MKTRNLLGWCFCLLLLMLFADCLAVLAQDTNATGTNSVPDLGDPNNLFPRGAAIWAALIPPATFFITWAIGKIPPLPKEILPWLTPVLGILLGFALDYANKVELPIGLAGALGTVAVFMYEGIKRLVIRQGEDASQSALTPTEKPSAPLPNNPGR